MRGILSKTLSALGFEPVPACNGIEALAIMEREGLTIEIIFADWNMPEMNGLEFLKALRAQPRFAAVPVIMVTSETDTEHIVEALTCGANEYIMKPFTADIVEAKLHILQVCRS
jgi:two-component system chemotaxis response regulator CheY